MKVSSFLLTLLLLVCCVVVTVHCQEDTEAAVSSSETAAAGTDNKAEEKDVRGTEEEEGNVETEISPSDNATSTAETKTSTTVEPPVQTGPFIDLLGPSLLSLQMVDETHAQLVLQHTNEALQGKSVVGLYFSADWCGPCRQFTPDLVSFYNKMNGRRGKRDQFEIVWISRCRDVDSFGQYFTQMNWLALPPEEAMGPRGQKLSEKYKVKSIPTLILLDEVGNVITADARNKIPQDKTGIGFPWRNPISRIYMTLFPKTLRLMVKSQISSVKDSVMSKLQQGKKSTTATA